MLAAETSHANTLLLLEQANGDSDITATAAGSVARKLRGSVGNLPTVILSILGNALFLHQGSVVKVHYQSIQCICLLTAARWCCHRSNASIFLMPARQYSAPPQTQKINCCGLSQRTGRMRCHHWIRWVLCVLLTVESCAPANMQLHRMINDSSNDDVLRRVARIVMLKVWTPDEGTIPI